MSCMILVGDRQIFNFISMCVSLVFLKRENLRQSYGPCSLGRGESSEKRSNYSDLTRPGPGPPNDGSVREIP